MTLSGLGRRVVQARFDGGAITSDGGALLLREAERHTGLLDDVSDQLGDARDGRRIDHSVKSMLRQRLGVDYILGFATNDRLKRISAALLDDAEREWRTWRRPVRHFHEQHYKARSWKRGSRLLIKAEHNGIGRNARFVVTSLAGDPQQLYDEVYCARGDMENRIKEQQLDLYADRTSAHEWWANQMRLLIASLAYTLVHAMRAIALPGTRLARATVGTLREKLLKIGAVVWRNTRRVSLHLLSHHPQRDLFPLLVARLRPG